MSSDLFNVVPSLLHFRSVELKLELRPEPVADNGLQGEQGRLAAESGMEMRDTWPDRKLEVDTECWRSREASQDFLRSSAASDRSSLRTTGSQGFKVSSLSKGLLATGVVAGTLARFSSLSSFILGGSPFVVGSDDDDDDDGDDAFCCVFCCCWWSSCDGLCSFPLTVVVDMVGVFSTELGVFRT